jgi:hypothetical protein
MGWIARFLHWLLTRIETRQESGIINVAIDPLGNVCHEADYAWVSRHSIAESDLLCPKCRGVAAPRGDFSKVRRYRFANKQINEGIKCGCMVKANGIETRCGTILYASPDTEHGDHLWEGKLPTDFYRFRRIDPLLAAQEEIGADVIQINTDTEQVVVVPPPEVLQPVHPAVKEQP